MTVFLRPITLALMSAQPEDQPQVCRSVAKAL